jgi:hypothetical protein
MVAVARNVYVAEGAADREAALNDTKPGGTEENALFGSVDEIIARLSELRAAGVKQVLINSGGRRAIESLRRFAKYVMPAMEGA